MGLHRRTHPSAVSGCFGCKIMTLQMNGSDTSLKSQMEAQWQRDGDAYQRLKQQGYEPAVLDGAAVLEAKATTRYEIESGQLMTDNRMKSQLKDAVTWFEQGTQRSVFEPAVTPLSEDAS